MKKHKNIKGFVKEHPKMRPEDIRRQTGYSTSYIRELRRYFGLRPFVREGDPKLETPIDKQAAQDFAAKRRQEEKRNAGKKYAFLQNEVVRLTTELGAMRKLKDVSLTKIRQKKDGDNKATAVAVASDWHLAETVEADVVAGLNEFNLKIAKARSEKFFQNVVRLVTIRQDSSNIDTLILALLGDFINGHIHDEFMEGNALPPIDELIFAQNLLASGIQFILDHTNVKLIIPCHSGNHGRTTVKQRIATERGNSFEYYMYHQLANHFEHEKRVEFRISNGYFSYVDVAGFKIRFHHGHHLRYGGGIGGLYIPVNKSIAQWNKGIPVDLDVFGHFHQLKWSGNKGFICNGSLVGYNAYAMSIKADYERAKQVFFIVNHKRQEVTDLCPIWVE